MSYHIDLNGDLNGGILRETLEKIHGVGSRYCT